MACRGCMERAEMLDEAKEQVREGQTKEAIKTVGKVITHAVKEVKFKFGKIE